MPKKIRLLFVSEELDINGASRSLVSLLKALPTEKYDISLFVFKHGGSMMKELPENITILPELMPYKVHRMALKQALKHTVKKGRFDLAFYRLLVSIQRYFNLIYYLWIFLPHIEGEYDIACCYTDGFVAPTIMRKTKAKKKICWIHFTYSKWAQPLFVYEALKRADICVTVSEDVGKDLDSVLGTELRKHIIHNITDASECCKKAEESCEVPGRNGKFRIVTVGRVTSQKNVEIFPDTAVLLKTKGIEFEWFVVGDGDLYQQLVEQTQKTGLEYCLHFIGSRSNPYPWMKSADVIVNPSKYEAWGMTVSEALCLGKAVIVSDIPVFAEQITDGVNGLICNAAPESLAEAIMRIYNHQELKHKLENNAVNYPFIKDKVVMEFDELVNRLLG